MCAQARIRDSFPFGDRALFGIAALSPNRHCELSPSR
jgi:hypothetical protein